MARKNSAVNLDVSQLTDGFNLGGGSTNFRSWQFKGADVNLIGQTNAAVTLPNYATSTLISDHDYPTKGALLTASAANTPATLPAGTDGYVLTADSTQTSGLKWSEKQNISYASITASTTAVVNTYYVVDSAAASLVAITLPATAALGDKVGVRGMSANLWSIVQNSGDTIYFLGSATTAGATGHFDSTTEYDAVVLENVGTGKWLIVSAVGNFNIV